MNRFMTLLAAAATLVASQSTAQEVADLNDLEFAHVAYTADNIDIRYAHLALAISTNPDIHAFAKTMISNHEAVNAAALGLLAKLGASAQDNFFSQALNEGAEKIINDFSQLRGAEFDMAYASNELAYHQTVNNLVENVMIPNIDNDEVRALFQQDLEIFKVHEGHAEMLVEGLESFANVKVEVTGLVLSQVNARGMRRYGHGDGSYGKYGKGITTINHRAVPGYGTALSALSYL